MDESRTPSSTISQPPPPPPPPLPSGRSADKQVPLKISTKVSPCIHAVQTEIKKPVRNLARPRPGWYFVYGTLMDGLMVVEILGKGKPEMRPALVVGYSLKLWGQYPALLHVDDPNEEVHGVAFEVSDQDSADRLAEYETKAYGSTACVIRFVDELGGRVDGYTFQYDGDERDLSSGTINLDVWLKRMGRARG